MVFSNGCEKGVTAGCAGKYGFKHVQPKSSRWLHRPAVTTFVQFAYLFPIPTPSQLNSCVSGTLFSIHRLQMEQGC
jgi:hypothetical protein